MDEILVTKPFLPSFEEYIERIRPLWDSHWLTNSGVLHEELEQKIRDYCGGIDCALVSSGHMALELAIEALGLTGEIITTPFTFASTTHAIVRKGLKPVFCDIKMSDFTIDENKIEALITPKTSAILGVHVYGHACNTEAIDTIAKKHGLKVIYDAAHAFGVMSNESSILQEGDASTLSFNAVKTFHTIEGGAVVSKNEAVVNYVRRARNFGISHENDSEMAGCNGKMNEFQAAMGLCNLEHLDEIMQHREILYMEYMKSLSNILGVCILNPNVMCGNNYSYFPILLQTEDERDELYDELINNNIHGRKYFYPLTCDTECLKKMNYSPNVTNARNVSSRVLVLPLHNEMTIGDVRRICSCIVSWRMR